ncbi:MAG: SocA family protein [Bryobacterales bacterium]|nr:SocA family protein [Bryobacterales bacterium]
MLVVLVSAHVVANAFLALAREENRALTNMQLQKLVFLAQGYCLAILGRPLYYHRIHAWQWGPVIPKLYKVLQRYGSGDVTEPLEVPQSEEDQEIGPDEQKIIRAVWNAYKSYSGAQLSALTHRKGTPWSETWAKEKFGVIPEEVIADYYRGLVGNR